jgi:hypothetical protein
MMDVNLSRRGFIKAVTTIAAVVAATPAINAFSGILTDDNKMDELEQAVFSKLVQVCLPTEGTSLVDPATLPVVPTIEGALLAGMAPHIRQGLRGGIGYFNEGPKAEFGKNFVDLSDADAAKFIDQWADSDQPPHRALAMGLKKLSVLAYFAIPPTWGPLGYDGPVTEKAGIEVYGNTPEPKA